MLKHKGTYAFVKKDTKDPAHVGYTEINTILEFRDNKVNILLNCRFIVNLQKNLTLLNCCSVFDLVCFIIIGCLADFGHRGYSIVSIVFLFLFAVFSVFFLVSIIWYFIGFSVVFYLYCLLTPCFEVKDHTCRRFGHYTSANLLTHSLRF